MTYAEQEDGLTKPLPRLCCNGLSCLSPKPEFMQRERFISSFPAKFSEINQEWIAYRTLRLKKWRKKTAIKVWYVKGVVEDMPDNLIMPDDYLLALAKSGSFLDQDQLVNFLKPWYGISKHTAELLIVFQKNRPYLDTQTPPFELLLRSEKKSALIAFRMSKKLKNLDNPILAEEARMTALHDKWLTERGKAISETKVRMKKAIDAETKIVEKQDKTKAKN